MPASRLLGRGAAATGVALLLTAVGPASAEKPTREASADRAPYAFAPFSGKAVRARTLAPDAQHGPDGGHLPPVRKNMEIVSKLEPLSQGPVGEEQIADVAVFKGFAYLQSGWNCAEGKGGFYAVDIRNPSQPREVAFEPALPSSYHGEGAQVIAIDTPAFRGDVLAVNNESCAAGLTRGGGFDLYDVTNPADPQPLTQGFGDFGGEGALTGSRTKANEAHSIFIWDAGDKAYAVIVDNEELHDVDVFDITNPRAPQAVREYDLFDTAPDAFADDANVGTAFHHDVVVKNIGGSFKMMASYWDAGYIQLNADNPAELVYEGDSDFGGTDPLTGYNPPEGNAHQSEYTHDNRMLVTGEEDFAPFRVEFIDIENVGRRDASMVPGGVAPNYLEDGIMNGPTAYVGYACAGSTPVPTPAQAGMPAKAPGEEWIAVVQRGPAYDPDEDYDNDGNTNNDEQDACFPGDKGASVEAAGWDAMLIVNRHTASGNPPVAAGAAGDGANCGSGGFDRDVVAVCTTHAAFHEMFGQAPNYTIPYDDSDGEPGDDPLPAEGPNIGDQGEKVTAEGLFDGWGYMSLYSTTRDENGKFPLLDAHAIKEALNPAYSFGFGDLSIHEQAADPTQPLSYASYYSGGMRVFSFDTGKIIEQGAYIDEGGNDFWGVEQFTASNGERLIAGSDRDYGLYIFRYTGPFAVGPRPAAAPTAAAAGLKEGRCVNVLATTAGQKRVGTAFGDQITGTEGRDVIDGVAGDDCIDGIAGNDDLRGGRGVDTIDGQDGNDRVRGDSGRGNLRGGSGNDRVSAGSSRDVLFGNTGRDRLKAGGGNDQLFGGAGADRLTGGKGKDVIEAGTGDDRIFAKDGRADRIDCGFGRDRVASRDRADRLTSCEQRARVRK